MKKNIFYILMIGILIFILIILFIKKEDVDVGSEIDSAR